MMMMMMLKMQEFAPVQPENSTMSSPSWAGTWWVHVVVIWAAPVGGAGWQRQLGLSDSQAAAGHSAERWG